VMASKANVWVTFKLKLGSRNARFCVTIYLQPDRPGP
jgi:hypothetical protein